MKMREIQEAASLIQEQAHEDANIIFGASIDENMGDAIKVTVIATGFDRAHDEIPVEMLNARARPAPSRRPTRRDVVRDSLREGFSNAPASRAAFSTARPVAPEMTSVSTRRPAALAASSKPARRRSRARCPRCGSASRSRGHRRRCRLGHAGLPAAWRRVEFG